MQNSSSLAGLEVTEKFVIRNIIFFMGGGVLIPFTLSLFCLSLFQFQMKLFLRVGVGGWIKWK